MTTSSTLLAPGARRSKLRAAGAGTVALGLGLALALVAPMGASAHVTFAETTAEPGSYPVLTLKVPNESDTAATTSVTLEFPADTPFLSVRTVPVPGWTAEVTREELPEPVQVGESEITEAVTSITWTADGAGIDGDQLQLFPIGVGPVPDVGSVVFRAEQGYSDGSVVPWEGEDAPTIFVNDAPVDHHGGDSGTEDDGGHAAEPVGDTEAADAGDSTGLLGVVLGAIGVVLGAAALVVAALRGRRSA